MNITPDPKLPENRQSHHSVDEPMRVETVKGGHDTGAVGGKGHPILFE